MNTVPVNSVSCCSLRTLQRRPTNVELSKGGGLWSSDGFLRKKHPRKNDSRGFVCCHKPIIATTETSATMHFLSCGTQDKDSTRAPGYEKGLGVASFLAGKKFLITGATGFLAKVLIEKMLRVAPDLGKLYIVIQAKNKEAAMKRMMSEIVGTELFRCLKETHGRDYEAFVLSKLVPVVGNVREANLGIQRDIADEIAEEVDVIINSAANTTFDERYDVALDINTLGPRRLMTFAKGCKKLKLFLQVSTAYVNGLRKGTVLEKPFCMGDSIAKESEALIKDNDDLPALDVEEEMKFAADSKVAMDESRTQEMKELGLRKARSHGWQDTYVFTKAMGEMVLNSLKGDLPVVTIRPSVIESTFKDPFPGWMEGNRMMDPIILSYGKGQLPGFLVDANGVLDVVPADMVVNAILAAMAKHGRAREQGMHVYHVASSVVNPLAFEHLADLLFEHFSRFPYMNSRGKPIKPERMKLFHDMNEFASHISAADAIFNARGGKALAPSATTSARLAERIRSITMRVVEQAKYLANIYEPYTFYDGRFDNANTQKLMDEMSEEEKIVFALDVGSINWDDYINNVHIPGLRKHVLKGRGMTTDSKLEAAKML